MEAYPICREQFSNTILLGRHIQRAHRKSNSVTNADKLGSTEFNPEEFTGNYGVDSEFPWPKEEGDSGDPALNGFFELDTDDCDLDVDLGIADCVYGFISSLKIQQYLRSKMIQIGRLNYANWTQRERRC